MSYTKTADKHAIRCSCKTSQIGTPIDLTHLDQPRDTLTWCATNTKYRSE